MCLQVAYTKGYWLWSQFTGCKHYIYIRLKKVIMFRKLKPRWNLEKLYAVQQKVQDSLEECGSAMEWSQEIYFRYYELFWLGKSRAEQESYG